MEGVAVKVVVEVLDQGVPVWVIVLDREAVAVRLPVTDAVLVAVSEGVMPALGVRVALEEPVQEAVLEPELVRLGVPVA